MYSMKYYKKINKYSTEFKRQLIEQVKKQPSVWKKFYFGKEYAWKEIEKEMDFACSLKELQKVWASLRAMYFRKIFIRTIERCFEAPNWIFFHDLTFLYDITKETIQRKLGGISPPLFKPNPDRNGSQNFRCPCCVYVGPDSDSEPIICSMEDKQDYGSGSISNGTSEKLFDIEDCNSNSSAHSETTLSICSLDDPDNENQTCFWTDSPKTKQNETDNPVALPSSHETMENKTCDVIDLVDDIETCIESQKSRSPAESRENLIDNLSQVNLSLPLLEMGLFVVNKPAESTKPQSIGLNNNRLPSSFSKDYCSENSKTVQELEVRSLDLTQSPGPSGRTTNGLMTSGDKSNDSSSTCISNEKRIVQNELSVNQIRAIERLKIIDAVKANPLTYLNYNNKRRTFHNQAWNNVSQAVGIPVRTVKNRWKLIKTRYLKELVNQRYSGGKTNSQWECFEKMEFLRSSMQKEINDIHDTRIQMQNTVRQHANGSSTTVNKEASNISHVADGTIDQPELKTGDKSVVTYVNTNQNIKIASVETVKASQQIRTYSRKSKQINQLAVLDGNVLPILQNRPVIITGVQFLQPEDLPRDKNVNRSSNFAQATPNVRNEINVLPSESREVLPSLPEFDLVIGDRLNDNDGVPPPTKKLRKCSDLTPDEVHNLASAVPTRPPIPPANCTTLDLTTDTTTTDPVTEVQPQQLQRHKPQKIYPPLDLTLDDDLSECPTVLKKVPTSNFQQTFIDQFVNTSKVFPTLDLTTEEDKDHDKLVINSDEIATRGAEVNGKSDENVICLDDDDSVGSYEELVVYIAEENKN